MKKCLYLAIVLIFAAGAAFAQDASPAESPSASPAKAKHKHSAKKEASPAASESPSASPAAEKHKKSKKKDAAATTAASPAAATAAASASPAKKSWFQKLTNPSPSPAAATTGTTKAGKQAEPMTAPAPGGGPGMVWVNSETHVYHKEGSRWYGRTKKGKYMKESDAIKEGDREEKEAKSKKA